MQHWLERREVGKEARRVLRPSGRLVIGWLVIARFDVIPLPANVMKATIDPQGTLQGLRRGVFRSAVDELPRIPVTGSSWSTPQYPGAYSKAEELLAGHRAFRQMIARFVQSLDPPRLSGIIWST